MNLIAKNIKHLREARGMSQVDVAKRIEASDKAVSAWERGARKPKMGYVKKLADLFDVPTDDFVNQDMAKYHAETLPGNIHPIHRRLIPVLGNVAAGELIWTDEHHDDYVEEDGGIRADFALRVKGDSMAPLIQDNDFVYVRRQNDVLDGQIAVVLTDDSATLKLVYHQPGGLQLVSLNPAYPPMLYSRDNSHELRIIGLAVSYKRSLITLSTKEE